MSYVLLVIALSVIHLVFGIALGWWWFRQPTESGEASSAEAPAVEPSSPTPPPPARTAADDYDVANDILCGLQEFTQSISDQVGRHTSRVSDITRHLATSDDVSADEEAVRSIVGQLVEANEQLKADLAEAQTRLQEQEREIANRTSEARTDTLTGLANRRAFDEQLGRRIDEWRRRETPLSLMLLDVDHFKKFNDQFGHQAGDRVLQGVAQVLRDTMRDMDVVARYGGEEFAVILPSTDSLQAERAVLRALKAVAASTFHHDGLELRVTTSIGLAEVIVGDDYDSLIGRADEALYASKSAGRNCGHVQVDGTCVKIRPADRPLAPRASTERRGVERRPFNLKQGIAPFDGQAMPAQDAYRTVQCLDISAGGFAYLTTTPPSHSHLVVALGVAPSLTYMAATVTYSTDVETPSGRMIRVGCRFDRRLQPADNEALVRLEAEALVADR